MSPRQRRDTQINDFSRKSVDHRTRRLITRKSEIFFHHFSPSHGRVSFHQQVVPIRAPSDLSRVSDISASDISWTANGVSRSINFTITQKNRAKATIAQNDDLLVCSRPQELLRRRTNREDVTARVTFNDTITRVLFIDYKEDEPPAARRYRYLLFEISANSPSSLSEHLRGGGFTSTVRGFTITDPPPPFDTRLGDASSVRVNSICRTRYLSDTPGIRRTWQHDDQKRSKLGTRTGRATRSLAIA